MGALRDVELVDGDTDEVAPAAHRRRGWWVLAAAVVVAGLLVGGQVWADARHDAHVARFDDVAGVVPPIPADLTTLWSYAPFGPEMQGATEVGSRLVAGTVSATTRQYEIRQLDRATGATVWSTQGTVDPSVDLGTESYAVCRALDAGRSSVVACGLGQLSAGVTDDVSRPGQIVTLDASDGSAVGSVVGRWAQWDAAGGRLTTAASTATGSRVTWTLRATDARGHEAWSQTLPALDLQPEPEADEDGVVAQSQYFATTLDAEGSRALVADQGHLFVVDDGELTISRDIEAGVWPDFERGAVVVRPAQEGATITIVTDDDRAVPISGSTVYLPVDDGTAPRIVLVQEPDRVSARESASGKVLWSTQASWSSALVLGGRVYLGTDAVVEALDLRTGDVAWQAPYSLPAALVTDGRGVWIGTETSLDGFALDDGSSLPSRDATELVPHLGDGGYSPIDARLGMLYVSGDATAQVVG